MNSDTEEISNTIIANQSSKSAAVLPLRKSILSMFREISVELDKRYDKYERIYKISRDITAESKRIIFFLHRRSNAAELVEMAKAQFQELRDTCLKELATELENEDPYYYARAFTNGLQEYIEAVSLHHFMKTGLLISHAEVQNELFFEVLVDTLDDLSRNRNQGHGHGRGRGPWRNQRHQHGYNRRTPYQRPRDDKENTAAAAVESVNEGEEKPKPPTPPPPAMKTVGVLLTQSDFMLGLCDLTGELMRSCVAAVGCGNEDVAFNTCRLVQRMYQGTIALHPPLRDSYNSKTEVMRQSVMKMERACCQYRIRDTPNGSCGFAFKDDDMDSGMD